MADNLKPYDPNKGIISFRLNPDAIIDEFGNLIPFRQTIGLLDSEAPWSEVGKSAVREIPFLGSLLAGEYGNAIKEAFLFGMPIKAPAKFKKELSKLPKDTQFKDIGEGELVAYSPTEGTVRKVSAENGGVIFLDPRTSVKDFKANPSPILNHKQVNSAVDNTNALEKLNKNDRLSFDADKYSNLNPYNLDRLNDPAFANSIEGKVLQEASDLSREYNGGSRSNNTLRNRVLNQKEAQLVTPHLKKTEQLYKDDFDNLYIKDRQGKYWYFQSDPYSGRIIDKYPDKPKNPVPYSDPTLGADLNAWKAKVNEYNANRQFEDNYINYKDPEQWGSDLYDAEINYYEAINGPFYQDIKKEPRY